MKVKISPFLAHLDLGSWELKVHQSRMANSLQVVAHWVLMNFLGKRKDELMETLVIVFPPKDECTKA